MIDPLFFWILLGLAAWFIAAYLVVPRLWTRHYRRRFSDTPQITRTSDGHPGDPVNIRIDGADLFQAMEAAGWKPADPITLKSSLRIAIDAVLDRPDADAPVSDLFLFGRKQDLSFELPVGNSPRKRHHVRFWKQDPSSEGRPAWIGSATFDERVGLSYTTGQITHHIGPDVDAERDLIMEGLRTAGQVEQSTYVDGFHSESEGRNGGGDRWKTDGRLGRIILRSNEK